MNQASTSSSAPHAGSAQLSDTTELLEAVIIGSGFGGLCMGIKLKAAGIHDFVILERAAAVGGTWRDNDYPGCGCDVQSHLYSFSFEQNPRWTRMFAKQPEIRAYLEHCSDSYALRSHLRFGQDVSRADYDEVSGTWSVQTRNGERYRARNLVSAMGAFSAPAFPDVPGLEKFEGKTFHSARWDHDYDLRGKRVAVIGTGASAVQFVPQIAPQVAELQLYQRSAPWIMPKADRQLNALEQRLFKWFPFLMWFYRFALYASLELRVLGFVNPKLMKRVQSIAQWHLRRQVRDQALRDKLTPTYALGCKRVLVSNDYYPAMTRDNVDVITTGIAEVRAHSIVTTDGVERPIDTIIFGTGFQVQQMMPRAMVFGRGGVDLMDAWQDRVEAYKGISVSGFPNMHLILGPNTGLGHSSMIYMIESQVAYVTQAITAMRDAGWKSIDVLPAAQRRFNDNLQARHGNNVWLVGCKSWYLDKQGRNTALWPSFTFMYRRLTSRFVTAAYALEPLGNAHPARLPAAADAPTESAPSPLTAA